jgi:hypothetical protein
MVIIRIIPAKITGAHIPAGSGASGGVIAAQLECFMPEFLVRIYIYHKILFARVSGLLSVVRLCAILVKIN